ncbi:MAG: hypothetical protein EA355_11435, partial [Rhodobacteraceae bacterium]
MAYPKLTCLAVAAAVAVATGATAATFTLEDRNSRVVFETQTSADGFSRHGMVAWEVNGINHMYEQNFWFRFAGDTRDTPLASLPTTFAQSFDTNEFVGDDLLSLTYNNAGFFTANVRYSLSGSDGCCSDIAEQVNITNTSSSPFTMIFTEYTDFDLSGTIGDTFAAHPNPNLFTQIDRTTLVDCPPFTQHCWYRSDTTVVAPAGTFLGWEISQYPDLRNRLTDDTPTVLANLAGTSGAFGAGDLVWAAQWKFTLLPGQSWQLSKDKLLTPTPIPLPAPAFLLLGGLAALGALKRRAA